MDNGDTPQRMLDVGKSQNRSSLEEVVEIAHLLKNWVFAMFSARARCLVGTCSLLSDMKSKSDRSVLGSPRISCNDD